VAANDQHMLAQLYCTVSLASLSTAGQHSRSAQQVSTQGPSSNLGRACRSCNKPSPYHHVSCCCLGRLQVLYAAYINEATRDNPQAAYQAVSGWRRKLQVSYLAFGTASAGLQLCKMLAFQRLGVAAEAVHILAPVAREPHLGCQFLRSPSS
jgi:hypothetical protein